MKNEDEADFWIVPSLHDPLHECFLFRRDGTEIRVKIWNGKVDMSTLRLHYEETFYIEKYLAHKDLED